jgi:hypothetical protein
MFPGDCQDFHRCWCRRQNYLEKEQLMRSSNVDFFVHRSTVSVALSAARSWTITVFGNEQYLYLRKLTLGHISSFILPRGSWWCSIAWCGSNDIKFIVFEGDEWLWCVVEVEHYHVQMVAYYQHRARSAKHCNLSLTRSTYHLAAFLSLFVTVYVWLPVCGYRCVVRRMTQK